MTSIFCSITQNRRVFFFFSLFSVFAFEHNRAWDCSHRGLELLVSFKISFLGGGKKRVLIYRAQHSSLTKRRSSVTAARDYYYYYYCGFFSQWGNPADDKRYYWPLFLLPHLSQHGSAWIG